MRKTLPCVVLLVAAIAALSIPAAAGAKGAARPTQFVVLYQHGAGLKAAHAAIRAAGGRIVRENRAIGLATGAAPGARLIARAPAQRALTGAAPHPAVRPGPPPARRSPPPPPARGAPGGAPPPPACRPAPGAPPRQTPPGATRSPPARPAGGGKGPRGSPTATACRACSGTCR